MQGLNIYLTNLGNIFGNHQNKTLHIIWKKVQKIAGKFLAIPAPVLRDSDGVTFQSHA